MFGAGRAGRRRVGAAAAVTVILGAVIGLSGAAAAVAPPFIVDDTADRVDANVGNGVCRTVANTCSLRAAIQEANSRAGADEILILPGTYPIAIAPINENAANVGDYEILDPVTIQKAPDYLGDVVIDGGNPLPSQPLIARGLDRLFEIHPGAGDVTIRNVTLQNGFSPEEGGAIQNWSLGKLTLDGVTVKDSYGEKAGGGLNQADLHDYPWTTEPPNLELLPHGRVEIKRSTFTGNGAGGGGGAINNTSGSTISISDQSVITLNPGAIKPDPLDPEEFVLVDPSDYPINASAISNEANWGAVGTIRVDNSTVSLNASEGPGAGISSWADSVVTIENGATLTQNRTAAEGGGLFTEGGNVIVADSEISKNQAANGGGLYSGGHVTQHGLRGRFDVSNSEIFENKAENGGGLHNGDEAQLFVTDTTFTKNNSSDHGAAIASEDRASMTLTRVTVVENESNGEGGGVWTHSERQHTIVDSMFLRNKAGVPMMEDGVLSDDVAGGGGLHTSSGPLTIVGTTFDGNSATEEGGGISMHNHGDILLRETVLENNRAVDGGGTENSATRVTFDRVTVQGNRAGAAGGGIYNTSSGEFKIIDSTIRENSGGIGGGLANAPDNHLIVRGSLFLNNSARVFRSEEGVIEEDSGRGGGIMSFADGDSLIENTTISGNKAAVAGGGLFHDADGELRITHVTIWRNAAPAGGGIGVVESDFVPEVPPKTNAAVVLKNSIVGGSLQGASCDWYVRSEGGNLETGNRNTCFLAVTAETAQSPIELGVRDRRGDPQLWAIADNGGATLTHALQFGSLAIDSSAIPCSTIDQRGVARPENGRCDAGAFEFVGPPPMFDDAPPETIFNPATGGPKQDSFETMAFTFSGIDNLTVPSELNFECRFMEQELTEPPEPPAPWDPVPPELQWNGCASPWSVPLPEEGLFTLEIRAIDRAGNVDSTPVSRLISDVGMTPPDTVIREKPPLQTNSRSALFSFTGISDFTPSQFMEYECRLDSRDPESWLECTNPAIYSDLTTGLHTFEVRALAGEAAGPDPTPARYTWRIGPNPDSPTDTPLTCDEANVTLTASADGWADQVVPLENYMFEFELEVRSDATVPDVGPVEHRNARAFFRFPIQDDAPDCVLESATLRLYSGGHTEGRILEAVPLEDTWKESSLNWVNQPDSYPGAAAATTEAGELYREWDVRAHVEAIRAGSLPNNGWVIRDQNESEEGGGDQSFTSREMPQDPPEVTLPELELRYVAASTPPPPPRAEPGAPEIVSCGQVITESTKLAADVTGCLTEGIAIGAPNIVLDLNGHTVSSGVVMEPGEEDFLLPGIRSGYPNVLIRNGTVTNFGYGVLLGPGSTHSVVEDMTLYKNALAGVQLFDADNGRIGALVHNNRFDSNGETGVQLFAGTEGSTVEDNFFVSNGMSIHLDAARANVIRNNEISGIILDPALDSDAGIVVENGSRLNVLENNNVSDTGDAGIKIHQGSHGTRVVGGVLVRNGDAGVIAENSDRIEIDGVLAHLQSDGGVVIGNSSGSSVKNSDLRYNPSGVDASNTNGLIVAGNDVSYSLQAGIALGNGIGMSILNNTASRTGGSGISLEGAAFDASGAAVGGALIEGNTANQNAESGLSIAVGRHTIRGNDAHNNAGFGIAAGELTAADLLVANIDGGGNRATGNAEVVQCLGVTCDESGSVPLVEPDTAAPQTSITGGPLGPPPPPAGGSTGSDTAVFTFSGNDGPDGTAPTALSFECRLDAPPDPVEPVEPELEPPDPNDPEVIEPPEGENWGECVNPLTILGLEPGEHTFEVRATDWAGNFDSTPAVYVWTVHAGVDDEGQNESPPVSPETRITAAPGELLTDEAGTRYDTTNRAATFRFVGSDNVTAGYNISYECRTYYEELNDALTPADVPSESVLPFEPCTSPKAYSNLAYGGHIFEVRAIDLAGNKDVTPAWHAWWIHPPPPDTTPPDSTISAGPDLVSVATSAIFEFAGTDNQTAADDLAFQCRLDGAMQGGEPLWTDCSSPYQLTVSSPATLNEHVLQVRAVDQSGNLDDVNGTTGDALPDGVPAAYVWDVGPAPVTKTVFCGQKVTQSIKVNNNLGDCIGHGLIVGADNITIDLNGKTIDGKSIGAGILNNGFDSVTVKNGRLMDFDFGVFLTNGTKLNIVEGVTAEVNQDAGVGLGHPTAPEDPTLPPPSEPLPGFISGVDGNVLRSNSLVANTRGVWIKYGARDNLVSGNLIGSTSGEGVWIERAGPNRVVGNNIDVASKYGVLLEGATDNVLEDNSITEAGTGVLVGATVSVPVGIPSTGNRVEGNAISGSAGPALEIDTSSDNELLDNVGRLTDSYAIELYLADDNVIRGNDVSANKGGISLRNSAGNVVESNDASNSDSTGIVLQSQSSSNVLRLNTSNNNDGSGIYIGDETPAGQGTLVEGNTTSGNNGMGIQAGKPSHIFRGNMAFDNGSWGINVGDPSNGRSNIDGGGNVAHSNEGPIGADLKPQQCYNIRCEGGPGGGDVISPNTSILEAPLGLSTESVGVFRFTGADDKSPVVFECRFESTLETDWQICTSPKTYNNLADGEYTFEVRARDFSGNVDPTPASYTWNVALGDFMASIDSKPERVTVSTEPTFTFSAKPQAGVTFQCVLQPALPASPVAWSSAPACTSPKTYTGLTPGQYEFWVRATDSASNFDTKMYAWTIGPPPVPSEVSCGQILTQSTRLLNDLVDCGGYGLIVGAPGITIDLDGHVVDGMGLDAGILNNGHDDVTITGGLVSQFLYGVQLSPGTARNVVHTIRVEGNEEAGIVLAGAYEGADGNTIRDNSVVANEIGIALYTDTRHAVIRGNNLAANLGEGAILLEFASDNLIEGNQLAQSGAAGVLMVGGGNNTVSDNVIRDSRGHAVIAGQDLLASNDNLVRRNTIRGGAGGVMVSGEGNTVLNNTVTGATGPGVEVAQATNTLVKGNDFGGNAGGIAVSESNGTLVEANNASGTLGSGIAVGEVSGNTIVRDNTASGNSGDGIEVTDSSVIGQGTLVENNTADANGGDGILVEGAGHSIVGNVAQLNGGWGIYTVGGLDLGGNFAAGNVEPEQCFGVVCELGVVPGAPETWIVSGPADVDTAAPGVQSNSRNASFTYMGEDEFDPITNIVFECRMDSTSPTAWADCEYPAEFLNLSPGEHTFEVRAIDQLGSGLADPTPAVFTWTYVPLPFGVPPEVIIDHKPPAETFLLEAIFTFHSNEPDVTFQCRVDSNGYQPCGFEGATFMNQGAFEWGFEPTQVGEHTFFVRAIDFEGNVGEPTTYTWSILGVTVAFTDGPGFTPATGGPGGTPATGGPTASTSAEIHFESNASDAAFWCRFDSLDPGAYFPCESPFRAGPAHAGNTNFPDPLLAGDHTLEVFGESELMGSAAELEPAVYEWEVVETVDTTPPETTIERAPGPLDLSSTIFEFSGTDDLTPPFLLTFECQITEGTAQPNENDWAACTSPFNLLDLYSYADPQMLLTQHTFYVRAIDMFEPEIPNPQLPEFEGNPDPTPASHTWTPLADTRAPSTTISAGPAEGAVVAEVEPPFEFFGLDNATPALQLEFQCAIVEAPLGLDAAEWAACDSPHSVGGLDPAQYTFAVRAVDLMANAGPAATRSFTVVGAPVVSIVTGPDGRIDPITGVPSLPFSSTEAAIFTYSSDQPGSTFECSLDGAEFVPCNTPAGTGDGVFAHAAWVLLSGEHELAIRATNAQGIVGEETVYRWVVELGPDVTAPNTTITSGPPNGTLQTVATFTFNGSDNRTPAADLSFECALDSTTSWNSCTSPEQYSDLTRGSHILRVRAVDAAGNMDASPADYTWIVAPPPVVTITSGPGVEVEGSTSTTATFEFTSDVAGVTFHCWLDGKFNPADPSDPSNPAPCLSGQTYENLGVGPHLFAVRAVDGFGNIGVWEDVEFDVLPPEARITSAPASSTSTTATFEFATEPADPDAVFYCSLDGRPFGLCSSPKTYTGLWGGEHTFQVQAVYTGLDWRGEPLEFEPVPATHTWTVVDVTPPETSIDFGPPATTISTSAYLGVSSDDPTATIECTLNGVPADCEAGGIVELTDLLPGSYTFTARAVDPVGNVDATPASRSWTIQAPTGAPNTPVGDNVVVSLPLPGGGGNATVTFFSVETAGFTTLDALGGGPPLPEGFGGGDASIYDISTTALFSEPVTVCLPYNPLDYGSPTPSVRLLHFDGSEWIDITTLNDPFSAPGRICGEAESFSLFAIALASTGMAPEAYILSGPDGPLNADGIPTSTSGSATFEFWVDQPGAVAQCSIDGESFVFCESPFTVGPLAAGDHEFMVQAINEFGWVDLTPALYEWEVIGPDVTPPTTTIIRGPPEGSSTPNFISTFEFSGTDDFTPPLDFAFLCTLDGVDLGNCETPEEIEVFTPGQHTLRVQAIDEAGNIDPVGAVRNWTVVDMSGPDTEITLGPTEETTETSATFEFIGFELTDDSPVNQFECALDSGEFAPCTSPHTITGVTQGAHVFHVRAVDPDGNRDISPDFYEWLVTAPADTTAPDTFIVVSPDPANSGPDVTFAFASDEPVETFECSFGSGTPPAAPTTWQECEAVWQLIGLASGQHWLWVRAIDAALNVDATPAPGDQPFTWITTGEPDTIITQAPSDPTGEFSARFVFESDQSGATFQCSSDGSPWTPCRSSTEEPYIAGPFLPEENGGPSRHTFEVRAVNQYRNVDGEQVVDLSPATHEWSVQDMNPPDTEFLGATEIGPEQFLEPGLRFSFRGDDDWASSFELTFECAFDNTADPLPPVWEQCGEPGANDTFFHEIAYADLEAGPYAFQVRALDVAENTDGSPAPEPGYAFVNEAEPETTITLVTPNMEPDLQTDTTTVTFEFSGTGVSFECALDSVTFTPCTNPMTYTDVPYGTHLFRVQAVAQFGTRDLSPAEFAWDSGFLTAPDVTITSAPAATGSTATTATFEFSSSDLDASFLCTLDGVGPQPCESPKVYEGLLAGEQNPHTFEVVATKANLLVDGVPATHEWTITDDTAPETVLLAPLPANPSGNAVEFRFTGTDNGTLPANLDFECRLDTIDPFVACSSSYQLSALPGGQHTLEVRAIDEVPLTDSSPASYTWRVVAPPNTVIDGPVEAGGISNSPDATFTFVDQPDSTYECRLDPVEAPVPTPFAPCTSPKEYTGLTNGAHVFEVRATTLFDVTEDPAAAFEWTIDAPDAIAPDTSIDLGFAESATTTSTSATFLFSGTDNLTAPAALTFECSLDGAIFEGCESGTEYPGLSVGTHTFAVRAIDSVPNVDGTPATRSWTVVAGATNTPAGTNVDVDLGGGASATFAEVAGDGVTSLDVLSGAPSLPAGYSAPGALFFDLSTTATFLGDVEVCLPYDSGSLDEPHLIHFDGSEWVDVTTELDPANGIVCGLVSSLSPFGIAEAPGLSPETEIAQAPADPTLETVQNGAAVQFQFSSSDPLADFECAVDGANWSSCGTPYQFTATIGEHTLLVRAVSQAGAFDLTPAAHTWTVLARPVATIDIGPEDQGAEPGIQNEGRTATFAFSSNQPPSTFECRLSGENTGTAWEPCTSPKTYENLGLEEYTFEVQAINFAGHVSLIPAQFEWEVADLTPPNTTIHSGPDNPTSSTTANFTFSADEPATFQCLLDGLPSACGSGLTITNLDPGTHTFEVLATDLSERENVELQPAVWTWTVDTQAPGVTLLETPPAADTATSATFSFSASDNHSSSASLELECRLDGQPAGWESCASPKSYEGLLPGEHTFEIRAVDEAGNVGNASHGWEVLDTIDPETEITSVESGSIVFHFTGLDDHSSTEELTFECSLDNAAFSACVSPKVYEDSDLSVGEHTFQVRAVDGAGNADATPGTHTWTVLDTTAPTTTIQGPPDPTMSPDATFTFTATEGATFECSLDGAPFEICESPYELSVEPGRHTLEVRGTDGMGNVESPPASYGWTVETPNTPFGTNVSVALALPGGAGTAEVTFPQIFAAGMTTISDISGAPSLPDGYLNDGASYYDINTTAQFSAPLMVCLSYDPPSVDAPVRLLHWNGAAWEDVTSSVDAVDSQVCGLADSLSPFAIATGPPSVVPDTTIDSRPSDPTASATATFTFSSNLTGAGFQCSLDGGAYAGCTSPANYGGLGHGAHTFSVRATLAGSTDQSPATYAWMVDRQPPETTIDSAPATTTDSLSASFGFSSEPGASFECALDGGAWAACSSPKSYSGLAVGSHTFQVRAGDAAGNVDSSAASYAWTVLDVTAPETTITAQPDATTAATSASLEFAATDNVTPAASLSFECSLDGGAWAACSSPKVYSGLAVGAHTFEVRASDAAGNVDSSAASYTWTVLDTTAPDTSITAQPDETTPSMAASFEFAGSDDTTGAASLTFQCALDGAAFADCTSPKSYSGLAAGSHTFQVRAIDAAGNVDAGPASYTWTVLDTTAPETSITDEPASSTASTSASFEFTGSDNVTPAASLSFECSLDGAAFGACMSPSSYTGLAVGTHTFRVRASDAAGNTDASPASYAWTVLDTIAPETTITGQPDATTPSTGASFTFTGSDDTTADAGLTFQCALDGAAFAACSSPKPYSGLAAGSHSFQVRAIDAAGNVDASPASYGWTVLDTIAPETTITGQPVATTTNTSASFSFTGSDDSTAPASLSFECALDGAAFAACTSPKAYSGLAVGSHTFQVRATDAAGNVDATPAAYTWEIQVEPDTTAPDTTITAEPPATTTETSASFSFSSSETPSTFECSLDGAAFAVCTSPKSYSGLAVGPHTFRVRASDAAGNVDSTPASVSWTIESPQAVDCGPQQTLTASADAWIDQGGPSNNNGSDAILKVMSKSNGNLRALVRFNLPAAPQGCSVESATLRIYAASGTSGRTIQSLQLGGSWTEGGVTWQNQPATTGGAVTTSSGTGYRELNVAGQVQAMYSGANNGFLVRDASENQDAEQQFHSREKSDNRPQLVLQLGSGSPPPPPGDTAPNTSITGSPLGATTSASATFTFTGADDVTPANSLTFECQLDVPETYLWAPCTSPRAYSGLGEGSHTFRVRAVDAALNADPSPAVYTWTIDQTAPETVISLGPGSSTTSTSASFQFSSPEPGATFQCLLDTGAFAACTAPKSYSGLALGSHSFQVRAVDAAGNIDLSAATYPWTITAGGAVNCGSAQTMPAVADSWIEQSSPSSNKGSDGILKVMSKSGNSNLRALVRFNLPGIPSGCVVDTATLRVYAGSASSSQRTLQVLRLNGSWTESGVTWANQPATTGSAVTTTSGTGYRQWSVAGIVQAMYSSGANNGFLIRDATEGQDAEQQLHAREKGENVPQLVVAFKPAP